MKLNLLNEGVLINVGLSKFISQVYDVCIKDCLMKIKCYINISSLNKNRSPRHNHNKNILSF